MRNIGIACTSPKALQMLPPDLHPAVIHEVQP